MKTILKIIKGIEESLLFVLMAVIVVACFLQVIGRYTELPFSNAFEEVAVNVFVWMTLIGAAVCVRAGGHMRMDIIDSILPKKAHPYLHILREFMMLVVFGFAAKVVAGYIPIARRTGMTTPSLNIPYYILYIALPLGFGLMSLWSIVNIVKGIQEIRSGKDKEPTEHPDQLNEGRE